MKKSNLQFYCAASVLLLIIGASILPGTAPGYTQSL